MRRIAFGIAYNGGAYHGWQNQTSQLATIQRHLECAFSKVANHPIQICAAGRTDAGVHAIGQVVHFDTAAIRTDRAWLLGVNTYLPRDISVTWVKEVSVSFHARFSALSRCYRYIIDNRTIRPALFQGQVTWYRKSLDVGKMQEASLYLLGTHDFTSFRGSGCQARSPVRTLQQFTIHQKGTLIFLDIEANAFLMHMVRNIVGMLLLIGGGSRPPYSMKVVLDAKDRKVAATMAPPDGLYLARVIYPELFELPLPGAEPFLE